MKLHELDNPPHTYEAERLACRTLADLKVFADRWKPLALEGWKIVQTMTETDFTEYQAGSEREQKGMLDDKWFEKFGEFCFPRILYVMAKHAAMKGCSWAWIFEQYVKNGVVTIDADGIAFLPDEKGIGALVIKHYGGNPKTN
jgi:hypothetical protein